MPPQIIDYYNSSQKKGHTFISVYSRLKVTLTKKTIYGDTLSLQYEPLSYLKIF
jgi:hypothetical protein